MHPVSQTSAAVREWRSGRLISSRNSIRVRASSRKTPSIALVVATEFCFSTPRIDMQR